MYLLSGSPSGLTEQNENFVNHPSDADIDYDRMGRKTRESNVTATSVYQYSATTLRPTLETLTYDLNRDGTPELTRQLDRTHDNLRRPTGFTLKDDTTPETAALYGYDVYGRLSSVGSAAVPAAPVGVSPPVFSYSYLQNSNLLASIIGPAHTVTNTWELDRDVLDAKENKVGAVSVSKLDYGVNAIGQRTTLSQTGTAFASVRGIAWGYDSYGQVTSSDSSIATQDRAYQYDAIGNRKKSADSLTLPVADNYTSNSLNQYSTIQQGGTGVSPVYDLDGNATSYPLPIFSNTNSTLTYDGENRLISTTVNGLTTTQQFDATGRRISKTTGTNTTLYLYEGWNVIAEYSRSVGVSPTLQKTYLWGTDLSGTMQGAGGVGGLLCESNISNPQSPISYLTYDGNGNISEYLTINGAIAAHFEYDAFGNTTINTDTGNRFLYKFSTKPQDVETGLYYYGYRYYDAVVGRWINRDPINERGGFNIYSLFKNDIIRYVDFLGLFAGAPPPLLVPPTLPITLPTPVGIVGGGGFFLSLPAIGVVIIGGITVVAGALTLQEIEAAIESQRRLDEARKQGEDLRRRIEEEQKLPPIEDRWKGCLPCNPPRGQLLHEIAPPGSRENGRHSKPGCDKGHVKLWIVNQSPYPTCVCNWNKNVPFTLEETQLPPPGSIPGGPPEKYGPVGRGGPAY